MRPRWLLVDQAGVEESYIRHPLGLRLGMLVLAGKILLQVPLSRNSTPCDPVLVGERSLIQEVSMSPCF